MEDFAWDPASYLSLMDSEVPAYRRLQDEAVSAVSERHPTTVLDLGIGSGLTAFRVAEALPSSRLVGIDENDDMLAAAASVLDSSRTELHRRRLQDPLPSGPFDVVMSMLAVHHLDDAEKADLFERVAGALSAEGRFVLADLIVPEDPADVVTEIDGVVDTPSTLQDQVAWLRRAGLEPQMRWRERDLVVLVAEHAPSSFAKN